MNYKESLDYIHSAPKIAKTPGSDALKKALAVFGNPHRDLKFIHIAGTNGKGSTSAMTESVLRCAGYRTGLFISPYLERFNERIKVCGEDVRDEELSVITTQVRNVLEMEQIVLPEFSIIFIIALLYFTEKKCDIVVLETGLGGRLDATNVIENNVVCAITSIGFDHTQYLGNTIAEITREKADIIKADSTIILYCDADDVVKNIVSDFAKQRNADVVICNRAEVTSDGFNYDGDRYNLSLQGEYQYSNASVALEIIKTLKLKGYKISADDIKKGLSSVFWPGRFEWLNDRILLDGCHNIQGAEWFVASAKKIGKPITIVTGVMADKDYKEIAQFFCDLTDRIIVTKPDIDRALEPEDYAKVFKDLGVEPVVVENSIDAVNTALKCDGVCAVCGSLYLIGEIRRFFK